MNGERVRGLVRAMAVTLLLVFGLAISASAATPTGNDPVLTQKELSAKQARVDSYRISQEQREAAAARMKLMKALALSRQVVENGGPLSFSAAALESAATSLPGPGGIPDYFGSTPNWAYSPRLSKFVDGLPGFGPANANNLGQYLAVGKPDTTTYPGSDYYEIELREYSEKLHSELPATTLRGYVQVNKGTDSAGNNTLIPDPIHYLGPTVFASKNRPVRVKFTNKLPTGAGGDLFIPVDTSVMGAGMGPDGMNMFTQNRGNLHLHGGKTVWISDGTPHQWITPAGENTPYPKGVSVKNVSDMPDPGDGSMTYFYSNQQSARMLWYHDHSYGITRLNVYAGEAGGYMITDDAEKKLIADGTVPSDQIPLILQDKTFVDAATILDTDPTWNWGTTAPLPNTGDLWVPHVYVPAQNPADIGGMNATGRWHYGPWFWPPVKNITNPPIPNPYYDPINAPWEPPLMPATPNPSMGMEAYNDTPLVNGTAYPKLTVQPKAYRLRILNAANDRFFNLQMYVADGAIPALPDGRVNTEVKMVPAQLTTGYPALWPTDGRVGGVPDPATAGPEWVQIGTESGFLPKPAIIPQQPVTWNTDPTTFNMGNVQDHSLLLGTAERADVVVDFSKYAGKTLILYNDAPTAFPALDQRTDYFTGGPDLRDTGGTSPTAVGAGPNTRTIMQINVAAAPAAQPFDLVALEKAFASTATTKGVFEASQDPIIVPDSRYDSTYNTSFTVDPYVRIYQNTLRVKTLDTSSTGITSRTVTMPLEPKAIQDEQGETFDPMYGRMSGKLGLEMPGTNSVNQNFILYGYIDPVTEKLTDSMTPLSKVGEDGTQIWKITHNGVDTHPIHFHLFDVQLINRVGWDGAIRQPDDNELGWKDTVRVSPLEDTIVALRPVAPKSPFGVPDSVRPLNPAAPLGSTMDFTNLNPANGQPLVPRVTNQVVNFGWEYVWHCHILSHEEMDMMRPMSLFVARSLMVSPSLAATGNIAAAPVAPAAAARAANAAMAAVTAVDLTWTDSTPATDQASWGNPSSEIGFRIERATVTALGVESTYTVIANVPANTTKYSDTTVVDGVAYRYMVYAYNAAGDSVTNAVTIAPPGFFDTYTVTPTAFPGGTITDGAPQTIARGADSTTLTIAPDVGYHITDVVIDGVSQGPITSYQFLNLMSDHTIWAFFAIDTFTITPSAGAGGSIVPGTVQTVNYGADSATFTITPDVGYHITGVSIDGAPVGAIPAQQFTNVKANHTISATFAIDTFTIAPSAGPNGAITPDTTQTVGYGSNSSVTITPAVGYHVADVLVDGVSVGAVTTRTFAKVTANHTISATFAIDTFTITPSAGTGGAITPNTVQTVSYGADSSAFTITPSAGYRVADVLVDGVSIGAVTTRTFTNVTANHTIAAVFTMNTFTITPSAGAGGTIAANTVQTVNAGANSPAFVITPNTGYHVAKVLVDGVSIGAVTTHTFTNVTADHTIAAVFAMDTFTITPSAGANGAITPGTMQTVNFGAASSFTIAPSAGYAVADVMVDGVSVGAISTYQFTNVTANHTISATFSAKAINRFAGSDRYAVALAAAADAFPNWAGVKHVVVVSGDEGAQFDAVSAGGLVGTWNAPLLLVPKEGLRSNVRAAIDAMPTGVKVHIVGGTGSVSSGMASQIDAIPGVTVDRIAGADRYMTATAVARRMDKELGAAMPSTVFVVNGLIPAAMYDALAASAVSVRMRYPVLLTSPTSVPATTRSAMTDLGLTNRYVVGNTSLVSNSVRSALGVPAANRISGVNRYDTATAVANKAKAMGWLTNAEIGFAALVPDALVGGSYMGLHDGALLFVTPTTVPVATSDYLKANNATITGGTIFGGTGSVSETVRLRLLGYIR